MAGHKKPKGKIIKISAEEIYAIGKVQNKYESPIDINFSIMERVVLRKLEWKHADEQPKLMRLTNSGDSVIVSAKWFGPRPYIFNGPLKGEYVFSQIHFHWGPLKDGGSEHTFDGERMPLEMHVMFFKSEYQCNEEAKKKSDGVLNLAMVAELQEEDSTTFMPIVDALQRIRICGTFQNIEPLPLSHFFQPFSSDFFLYWGNIITFQNIMWIVSRTPLAISANQVKQFLKIRNKNNKQTIESNFRTTKPLQDRTVLYVNPDPKFQEKLIIPLAEIQATKKEKKKQKYNDVNISQSHDGLYEPKVHFCYEIDEVNSNEDVNKKVPAIENSDIEDLTNDNYTMENMHKETTSTSSVTEEDSLLEINSIKEIKRKVDEPYDCYLDRLIVFLKSVTSKAEYRKMQLPQFQSRNLDQLKKIVKTHLESVLPQNQNENSFSMQNSNNISQVANKIVSYDGDLNSDTKYRTLEIQNQIVKNNKPEKYEVLVKKSRELLAKNYSIYEDDLPATRLQNNTRRMEVEPDEKKTLQQKKCEKTLSSENQLQINHKDAIVKNGIIVKPQDFDEPKVIKRFHTSATTKQPQPSNNKRSVTNQENKINSQLNKLISVKENKNKVLITRTPTKQPLRRLIKRRAQSDPNYNREVFPKVKSNRSAQSSLTNSPINTGPTTNSAKTPESKLKINGQKKKDMGKFTRRIPKLRKTVVTELFMKPENYLQTQATINAQRGTSKTSKPQSANPTKPHWKY